MKLFHGSTHCIEKPLVERGRTSTDFGKGFYTTTNIEQAKAWALSKKKEAAGNAKAIVSCYDADDDLLDKPAYDTLRFDSPERRWLDFVVGCRKGVSHTHALVFGPVANDKIYTTIRLYEDDIIDAQQTLRRLKINDYYNQISFHTPEAARELRFVEAIEV